MRDALFFAMGALAAIAGMAILALYMEAKERRLLAKRDRLSKRHAR